MPPVLSPIFYLKPPNWILANPRKSKLTLLKLQDNQLSPYLPRHPLLAKLLTRAASHLPNPPPRPPLLLLVRLLLPPQARPLLHQPNPQEKHPHLPLLESLQERHLLLPQQERLLARLLHLLLPKVLPSLCLLLKVLPKNDDVC